MRTADTPFGPGLSGDRNEVWPSIHAMLRAIVLADHDGFTSAYDGALRGCMMSAICRDDLVRTLEVVLRSAWATAIAQGSDCQRELLMKLLGAHADLKVTGGTAVRATVLGQSHLARVPALGTLAVHRRGPSWDNRRECRPYQQMSQREMEVLKAVADGLTNKQIAQRLSLSPNTVKRHMARVMCRLGIHTRTALAVWYSSGAMAGADLGVRRMLAKPAMGQYAGEPMTAKAL